MPIRAGSTYGCVAVSQRMAASTSFSSCTPSRRYAVHAEQAPLPLALRGSQRKTTKPRLARGLRQPLPAAAVELDAVQVLGDRAIDRAREIDPAVGLIHLVQAVNLKGPVGHFPLAAGHRPEELAGAVEVVDVAPAGAGTGH